VSNVIESKVIAAAAGSGAGVAAITFIDWLLGVVVFGASSSASKAADALAAVPAPVSVIIGILVTVTGTFFAGYSAPHTDRTAEEVGQHAAP